MKIRLTAIVPLIALLTSCNTPGGNSPFNASVPTGDDHYPGMSILPIGNVNWPNCI